MEEKKTNLREADAKIFVEGLLAEKSLEVKTENGKAKIAGYLTLKTSDVNFVRIGVNVNEKTKNGADNKCYTGMKTVMNEYKSISEVGEEEADKLKVSGEINLYRDKKGIDTIGFKSNFFNRVKVGEEYTPRGEFRVETYISNITPEVDKEGEKTGRMLVHGWVPTYNGIEPIKLVADEEIGRAIKNTFEIGETVEFYGDIINQRIETVTEIPVAIGKPRKKVTTEYKNAMLIHGASEAYEEGVTPEKPYEKETILAAIQERKNRIEEEKTKTQSSKKPSGAAHGRSLGF